MLETLVVFLLILIVTFAVCAMLMALLERIL